MKTFLYKAVDSLSNQGGPRDKKCARCLKWMILHVLPLKTPQNGWANGSTGPPSSYSPAIDDFTLAITVPITYLTDKFQRKENVLTIQVVEGSVAYERIKDSNDLISFKRHLMSRTYFIIIIKYILSMYVNNKNVKISCNLKQYFPQKICISFHLCVRPSLSRPTNSKRKHFWKKFM